MKSYERYAKKRDELGYTDEEIASETGVSIENLKQWHMSYLTKGILGNQPKLESLCLIASVLGIGIVDFVK